jgi:hypothetical protein
MLSPPYGLSLAARPADGKGARRHTAAVTGGTAGRGPGGHPEQVRQSRTASEETTMRHALVPVQLLHQARATIAPARAAIDAEPEEPTVRQARRARRFATLTRRARA